MNLSQISPKQMKELESTFLEMKKRAQEDPVYFFDTFLYTFDPKNEPYHMRFVTFDFQKRLIRSIIQAIEEGDDLFIEKCREMGATYTVLGVLVWMWLWRPAFNALVGSRKEDYVDNRRGGVTGNKEESLFGKLDYMISRLPSFILPIGFNPDKHFNYMSLSNPENGNVISGESANPNFSRGSRRTVIILDEFAFWENDSSVWGSTADTTNCRIIMTTPGIKPSKAKRLKYGKDGEKIKVITLYYHLDPRKDKKWLDRERARRSVEDFNREIMINWELSMTGRVYSEIENAAYGDFPLLVNSPTYYSWDFGFDGVSVLMWQRNMSNAKWRLVDSYHNDDKPMPFYLPLFGGAIDSKFTYTDEDIKVIEQFKQYPKGIHFGDPDVKKRSFDTGETTRQVLERVKVYVQSITKNDFPFRREITKVALQTGIEINSTPRNEYFLEAIKSARYPQRKEDSQATTPIVDPIHDWTSHPRTAMEYFFINIEAFTVEQQPEPSWAQKTRSWLTSRNSIKQRRHA
jgi:hypothetical protein